MGSYISFTEQTPWNHYYVCSTFIMLSSVVRKMNANTESQLTNNYFRIWNQCTCVLRASIYLGILLTQNHIAMAQPGLVVGRNATHIPEEVMPKPIPKLIMPCGTNTDLRPSEELFIESPNFSDKKNYPNSVTCKWGFQFKGCTLTVTCPHFQLSSFLCFDYLEIADAYGKMNRFCGSRGPSGSTFSKAVNITFRSSSFFNDVGFRCQILCSEDLDESPTSMTPAPMKEDLNCSCGISANSRRIVGGVETDIGEFPWMAGLVRKGGHVPFCGASLINNRYVLTAAHCVSGRNPGNLEIILNEHNYDIGMETTKKTIKRSVELIIPHRKYSSRFDYDAALIKLTEKIDLQHDPVLPVCLPKGSEIRNEFSHVQTTVTGWGVTQEDGQQSKVLLKTNVTTMTNDECRTKYTGGSITDRMLCAAANGKDACQGDSGGPLSYLIEPTSKKYVQVGIVSWGHGCARPEKPGVYTRITELMGWISRNTMDASYCKNSKY